MSSLLFPAYKLSRKKYSARNYMWRFWKGERLWYDSKQSKCLCRSSHPKGSLNKVFWEISQNSQENICTGIDFWCFLVNFAKLTQTHFLQNSNGRPFLIIAGSILAEGVLANKTVNYEAITKGYVLIWARGASY